MPKTTPTTPAVDLDEQTANDVALLAQLTREMKERAEIADEVKARLREHLPAGHRFTFGGREVLDLGEPGQQFDAKLAAQVIPQELHAACSVVRLDGPTAKRILPADLYARCCTPKAAAVKTL